MTDPSHFFFHPKNTRCQIDKVYKRDLLDTVEQKFSNSEAEMVTKTLKRLPPAAKVEVIPDNIQKTPKDTTTLSSKRVSYNKKHYKLHLGDKGGKYITVKGQRVYLKDTPSSTP